MESTDENTGARERFDAFLAWKRKRKRIIVMVFMVAGAVALFLIVMFFIDQNRYWKRVARAEAWENAPRKGFYLQDGRYFSVPDLEAANKSKKKSTYWTGHSGLLLVIVLLGVVSGVISYIASISGPHDIEERTERNRIILSLVSGILGVAAILGSIYGNEYYGWIGGFAGLFCGFIVSLLLMFIIKLVLGSLLNYRRGHA